MSCLDESYNPTKIVNEAQDANNKRTKDRKRCLLYLIHHYLEAEGHHAVANTLFESSQLSNNIMVCDNIDLGTILQEFETYYHSRFQKYPKFCRSKDAQHGSCTRSQEVGNRRTKCKSAKIQSKKEKLFRSCNSKMEHLQSLFINGSDLTTLPSDAGTIKSETFQAEDPVRPYSCDSEEKQALVELISKEMVRVELNVQWGDVIGVESAKALLRESVVYPLRYPQLFQGILAPWRAVLLYGPPGTGKTMLAKAVASEAKTTFFNVSASSIISKWRGESEKLIRVLFELARHHAPSTIFIDEFDGMICRSGQEDHEGSRRLRAELLVQLDGLLTGAKDQVFLLAATNSPWRLDPSMVRRFEKRILVDVPSVGDRAALLKLLLPPTQPVLQEGALPLTCSIDYQHIAEITEGYTGSDLKAACREAAMTSLREIIQGLENKTGRRDSRICKPRPVVTQNLEEAVRRTKPTTLGTCTQYHQWEHTLGAQ